MTFYRLLRPLLFRLDPERAHAFSLVIARHVRGAGPLIRWLFARPDPCLRVEAMGLKFPNPIGLAAGYDKNGAAADALLALGFGHVELGTFTQKPQVGNPAPRLHRLVPEQAIINSLGFPNAGLDAFAARQERRRASPDGTALPGPARHGIVGINVGKGKDTPLEDAATDYAALTARALSLGDYVTVNISSPNTKDLRQLQSGLYFDKLMAAVADARGAAPQVPVLVKIAPDLSRDALHTLIDAAIAHGMSGIIATNTTLSRDGVPAAYAALPGGLSGALLRARSLDVVRETAAYARGRLTIIAAGGIATTDDVTAALGAGAALIQLYTALIFAGPQLPGQLARGLRDLCRREGVASVADLVRPP